MKIKKQLIPQFQYPYDVMVHVPYVFGGLGDIIEWPNEIMEIFGNAPSGGRNIFYYQFFKHLKKNNIKKINYLEVGVFLGRNVIEVYKTASYFGIDIEITVVDTFEGTKNECMDNFLKYYDDTNSFKNKFLENLEINGIKNVTIFEGYSDDFYMTNSKKFDLIYLDADHSFEAVKRDINNSLKIINPNGIISGDDYHPCWGVFDAVNSYSNEQKIKIVGEMWYFDR